MHSDARIECIAIRDADVKKKEEESVAAESGSQVDDRCAGAALILWRLLNGRDVRMLLQ